MNELIKSKILKRTFEGETNPEKNLSPITSKYSPSKKWALVFDVKFSHGGIGKDIVELFSTKKEATERITSLGIYGY